MNAASASMPHLARSLFRRLGTRLLLGSLLLLVGCEDARLPGHYQGYLEAEFVYVSSPEAGALRDLQVARGQTVGPGSPLFTLDPEPEQSAVQAARQTAKEANARLDDLRKGLRPSELAALEAKRDQAKVSLELAQLELQRVEKLRADNVVPVDELDRARSTRDLYTAQLAELTADLETAHLGGRPDAIQAAEAALAAAQAQLTQAEWRLAQKSLVSPTNAIVHDTLFRPGEWVAPGNPVVALFPPNNLKVRFFAPQGELAQLPPDTKVTVTFDGAPAPYPAHVSYVSTQAEFTPPVIYSRETREKLVFMIEARFDAADLQNLRPGQPVDVILDQAKP